jgi:hypothetical protein
MSRRHLGWHCRAEQAAEKRFPAVILSEAKNLALRIFKNIRNSSSSANKNGGLLRMTAPKGFSAACETRRLASKE